MNLEADVAAMPVSPSYREFVLEQLRRVAPVTARSMFGAAGLYSDGLFFGLMDDDTLYLKTDDTNRPDFEAAGMQPFRPYGPDAKPMRYHQLPDEVLEDPEALRSWMDGALAAARRAKRRG